MPKLYQSIVNDIHAASLSLPKEKRAAYIQKAMSEALKKPLINCIPGT